MIGDEYGAELFEFGTQFLEIVDLAVEDDAQRAVGSRHRLFAAGKVEKREAAKAQICAAVGFDQIGLVIGSAMGDARRHAAQNRLVSRTENSGDPTHLSLPG